MLNVFLKNVQTCMFLRKQLLTSHIGTALRKFKQAIDKLKDEKTTQERYVQDLRQKEYPEAFCEFYTDKIMGLSNVADSAHRVYAAHIVVADNDKPATWFTNEVVELEQAQKKMEEESSAYKKKSGVDLKRLSGN